MSFNPRSTKNGRQSSKAADGVDSARPTQDTVFSTEGYIEK